MRKKLYSTIKEALQGIEADGVALINHIDLWNEQKSYIETEQPFNLPAVFIEIMPFSVQPLLLGNYEAEIEIKLHIFTDSRVGSWEETMENLNVVSEIEKQMLENLNVEEDNFTIDTLTLKECVCDHNFDEIREDIDTYSWHVTFKANRKSGSVFVGRLSNISTTI